VTVLADLAAPFNLPRFVVDGTDAGAVHDAAAEAFDRARRGGGPTFIEAQTVRWPGNLGVWAELVTGPTRVAYASDATSIPGAHREWFTEHDAVIRYARELLDAGASAADLQALEDGARREMEAAVRFALDSPWPRLGEAFEDVYADPRVSAMIGPRAPTTELPA
jgi:pyruvate dehydrogenase E1 component alpha subunit